MKLSAAIAFIAFVSSAQAFSPHMANPSVKKFVAAATEFSTTEPPSVASNPLDKPLRDPFGLYPKDAPERTDGLLQALETQFDPTENTVKDPLDLYNDKSEVDTKLMSVSLPFLKQPPMLDGTLPGDRGFDPFNFSADKDALQWYRTAEVKHARLAMLVSNA